MTPLARAHTLLFLVPTALLAGALAFQHVGGLAPCEMCLWQRWPHLAAISLALAAFALSRRPALTLAALAVLVSGAIGVFHVGVEQRWWEGVTACAGAGATDFASMLATPLVRCDTPAWVLGGVSMAGWNAIISIAVALAAFALLRKPA